MFPDRRMDHQALLEKTALNKMATVAAEQVISRSGSDAIAPDCRGLNFWQRDRGVQELLSLYLEPAEFDHFRPHFDKMGELAGGRLDELATIADQNPPVLQPRDRFGRDEDRVEYHSAYREMETLAWSEFGLCAMSHRPGVLGWPEPVSPLVKYTFTYLFVQAEFGLMCPVSGSDTAAYVLFRHGDDALKARLANMLSQDMDRVIKVTQFMTEKAGGSDLGSNELSAERDGDVWRLHGEKWFCSHVDADFALVLARPAGAVAGTKGLGLFAVPRILDDGSRNSTRVVRLKDKLGTRSMATGEVIFDGARAYAVGDVKDGIKIAMTPVNLSRLSHGVRAAAMMRRCLNEAFSVARDRVAFGKRLIEHPLMRRQLMKLMVPTEQALSVYTFVASTMRDADNNASSAKLLRIATALLKFRACRDNIKVATGAMEVRGGLGYIEEWINARLVRDAQIGVLWEGTSNINGLDVITRAVRREGAHEQLQEALLARLEVEGIPVALRSELVEAVRKAVSFAVDVANDPALESYSRQASSIMYHAMSACLLAWEGAMLGCRGGDARRLLLARMVLQHRLGQSNDFDSRRLRDDEQSMDLLLTEAPVSLERVQELVVE